MGWLWQHPIETSDTQAAGSSIVWFCKVNEEYNFLSEWVTSSKQITCWFTRKALISSEHEKTILSSFVLSIAKLPGLSNSDFYKLCSSSSGLWISYPIHLYCTEEAVQRPVCAWIKQSRLHVWLTTEGILFSSWLFFQFLNFFFPLHIFSPYFLVSLFPSYCLSFSDRVLRSISLGLQPFSDVTHLAILSQT